MPRVFFLLPVEIMPEHTLAQVQKLGSWHSKPFANCHFHFPVTVESASLNLWLAVFTKLVLPRRSTFTPVLDLLGHPVP